MGILPCGLCIRAAERARQGSVEPALEPVRDLDHGVDVDPGGDTFALKHPCEILGREVAGGAGRERASARAADRALEQRRVLVERRERVRHGGVAGVVQVHAEAVVVGDRRLEQRQAALGQRDVDHLSTPVGCGVTPVERGEDAVEGEKGGHRVAEREAEARRRAAGEAVEIAQPAQRLGGGREAGT
jgi:hypothetical protein